MQVIQYFDGLGRLSQTVQVKGSTLGNDVVQPVSYDEFSREANKYLPYALTSGTSDGSYKTNSITNQDAFYTSPNTPAGVSPISTPAAGILYEPSPLNRVAEQGAPGDSWQLSNSGITGSGHTIKVIYSDNDGTTYWAKKYSVSIDGSGNRTLIFQNSYSAGQLYVTVSKNENWLTTQNTDPRLNTTEEYKDKDGRLILKRTYNYTTIVQVLSTYYVYDDLNNLCYVLPPASNADGSAGITSAANQTVLDNFCYQYQYDLRNRMIQKKIPGKGPEYMAYNVLDQLVATQDANQRAVSPQQWTFTKYDGEGRVVIKGIYLYGSTAGTNYLSTIQSAITAVSTLWETPVTTGNGYTTAAWPTSWTGATLSINYYDNYNIPSIPAAYSAPAGYNTTNTGLLTASQTNILGSANMLWAVNYYDGLGRNIQTYQQHFLGGILNAGNYDQVTTTYNFNNQPTTVTRKHWNTGNTSYPLVTIANRIIYDHIGRKLKNWEQITNLNNAATTRTLISQISYNEIGQVKAKQLHSTDSTTFLQNIAYVYNERGWLSKINDPTVTPLTTQLFSELLQYDKVAGISNITPTAQFNGNIASQTWWSSTASSNKSYTYIYDNLNRLTSGVSTDNYSESGITYDLNGNITKLNRTHGTTTNIDMLTYTPIAGTNQIQTILDGASDNSNFGYRPGTYSGYHYDLNGNMNIWPTPPNGSAVANITATFNLLNLPQVITLPNGTITYTYDANGMKLRKVAVINSVTTTTDYIQGIQYKTATAIDFIQTEEGKTVPVSNTYDYIYHLVDHLGNARVTFHTSTGTAAMLQQDDYYPFGYEISRGAVPSPKNEYLYNKKELQEELTQYDYGARFYDPVIGRWTAVDPKAEKYFGFSPYNYTLNDPIANVDPNGKEVDVKVGGQKYIYNEQDGKLYDKKGNEYTGDSKFAAKILTYLNKMNGTTIGNKVLSSMTASSDKFVFKDKVSATGAASFTANGNGHGGTISAGGLMKANKDEANNFGSVAHELFHGYQAMNGNTGSSVNQEVEAYVYSEAIRKDAGYGLSTDVIGSYGKDTPQGGSFNNSFNKLLSGSTFSNSDFNNAVQNFQQNSLFNRNGVYTDLSINSNYQPVIDKIYPLTQ
jgi:RHS repeat-associated protein